MPDYSKCVIYTIKTGDGVYVGATCNFVNRKYNHKYTINNEASKQYNYKLYQTIRENEGAWDMQPHVVYPCNSKMEMNIEEERVRIELSADLNSQSCYGFDKNEYNKKYKLANNDKHREYMRQYNKTYQLNNKDKIAEYKLNNKEKKREYMTQYNKEYYLKKKNELK